MSDTILEHSGTLARVLVVWRALDFRLGHDVAAPPHFVWTNETFDWDLVHFG